MQYGLELPDLDSNKPSAEGLSRSRTIGFRTQQDKNETAQAYRRIQIPVRSLFDDLPAKKLHGPSFCTLAMRRNGDGEWTDEIGTFRVNDRMALELVRQHTLRRLRRYATELAWIATHHQSCPK